jgi:hypothetical protein
MMNKKPNTNAVECVSKFVEIISKLPAEDQCSYTYRGQSDKRWSPTSSIMRDDRTELLLNERDAVRKIQAIHPQEFYDDRSMFDRLGPVVA